ncbi:hypothetical protein BDZ45DRAFT_687330 [Acephala macrosclerotiorum]|nr:hypothetical protein BDZ45DRAFT_687330 [Acephala macrosclerotiorum]
MSANFFEVFVIEPLPGKPFSDPEVTKNLQRILDQAAAGIEPISFQFRKSINNANQLLFTACWTSIVGHDDMDLRGITPQILRALFANAVPVGSISPYFFFGDASKIDWQAQVWTVEGFHVKAEEKGRFQHEVEKSGLAGAWCITKKVPPRPTVMPTDPVLVKIIEAGEERAKARLALPNPDIWVTISGEDGTGDFGTAVKDYVSNVESGKWEKYLLGSSFIALN